MKHRNSVILALAFFAMAVVLIYILKIPIGIADGGGLYKTLEGLGLSYFAEPSPDYFDVKFNVFDTVKITDTPSAIAAFVIGKTAKVFDVRRLALAYSIFFIIAILLVIKSGLKKDSFDLPFAALCVLVFADISYTSYFNTFYAEGAVQTAYIAMCAFILLCYKKNTASSILAIPAAAFAVLFAFCGILQAWVGFLFGFLIIYFGALYNKKIQKIICIIAGCAVVFSSAAFVFCHKSKNYEKDIYNAVFLGVAQNESVSALGLDGSLDMLCDVFYTEEAKIQYDLKNEFYNKISYAKIVKFYLTHPVAFGKKINSAARNAYGARPSYLGNYARQSGKSKQQAKFFSLYSSAKSKFIPNTILFTTIFFALYFAILIYIHMHEERYRTIVKFALCLGLGAVLSLIAPIIISGEFEIGRSLFTYNLLFDSIVVFSVIAGGRFMHRRKNELQNKYGLNSDE